jgi:uncharacterized protein DUF3618
MTTRKDAKPPTDKDLQREVELTRLELSRTVDQLADKLDVKAQARRRGRSWSRSCASIPSRSPRARSRP